MVYVMGIDGGGTKTTGVISNARGEVLAEVTVGPSNPNGVTKESIKQEMTTLFYSLKEQHTDAFFNVKSVFAGMSGAAHPSARKKMYEWIAPLLPDHAKLTIHHDAITALYSGTLGKPGIVQIAGTGSITFGLNADGKLERVGGWGYLIGEKGSGYALGRDGLEAAFRAHDGLDRNTKLTSMILTHFQVSSLPDVIPKVYHSDHAKEVMASLSKLVVQAADDGDQVSQKIITNNAVHIGKSIHCLIKKMDMHTHQVKEMPVVLVGGVFNRFDLFKKQIEAVLQADGVKANLILPDIPPVGGAVIAALREEDLEIEPSFQAMFSKGIEYLED